MGLNAWHYTGSLVLCVCEKDIKFTVFKSNNSILDHSQWMKICLCYPNHLTNYTKMNRFLRKKNRRIASQMPTTLRISNENNPRVKSWISRPSRPHLQATVCQKSWEWKKVFQNSGQEVEAQLSPRIIGEFPRLHRCSETCGPMGSSVLDGGGEWHLGCHRESSTCHVMGCQHRQCCWSNRLTLEIDGSRPLVGRC